MKSDAIRIVTSPRVLSMRQLSPKRKKPIKSILTHFAANDLLAGCFHLTFCGKQPIRSNTSMTEGVNYQWAQLNDVR